MSEKKNKEEDKPKNYSVKISEGISLTDTASNSISVISGSIKESYAKLSGTFDTNQKFMANQLGIQRELDYLPKIAATLEESRKLAEEQRKEAMEEAEKERKRFYVAAAIGVVGLVVAVITLLR